MWITASSNLVVIVISPDATGRPAARLRAGPMAPPPELTASARPLPDPPLREGRELGWALLDVAGHAFFEVVGLERGFHLLQGPLERVGEVGVEVEIDLGLDHRHRARRAVEGQVTGVGARLLQHRFRGADALDEADLLRLLGQ